MIISIFKIIKLTLYKIAKPKGKYSFLSKVSSSANILDIGCGKTPNRYKPFFPNSNYTGIDIDDHFVSKENLADKYILTTPANFISEINKHESKFDVTISSHNLEHCDDRDGVLNASLRTVKSGGMLYLSFPSEDSVNFPCRHVTLNYFDDNTHKVKPPEFEETLRTLESNGYEIIFKANKYRPFFLRTLGWLFEPLSRLNKKVYLGTWEYYGFETVIWARKN